MPKQDPNRGSYNWDDPDRPRWISGNADPKKNTTLLRKHDYYRADGEYAYTIQKGINPNGDKVFRIGRVNLIKYKYRFAEQGLDKPWFPGLDGEPLVLYRLPELIEALAKDPGCRVLITEGERDADTAAALGYVATCNPSGALKWRDEYSPYLKGAEVIVVEDNDERGRMHAKRVAWSVMKYARSVRIWHMPDGIKDLTELMEKKFAKAIG